jgi:peptidoglycan-associated lipoprotein
MTSDERTRKKNIDELRVYFDSDEWTPNIESAGVVDVVVDFMKDYPVYVATIEGHTDDLATREYNLALGSKRANKVRDMMVAKGIDSYRIKTISYGKERPEFIGSNEANWQRNRRAVFVLC